MLIDIEGIDGSGKGTQARLLCERLQAEGISHRLLSFPRYAATFFGRVAGEFLNGRFGSLDEVDPFLASLIFAGDRYESRDVLRAAMDECRVVVLDRYVPSNVAHQAAKRQGAERDELISKICTLEYEVYKLPRATLSVLLDLPVGLAQQLIARKAARNYTDLKADLQEADGEYLEQVREVYLALAQTETDWHKLDCATACGAGIRTEEQVASDVWTLVRPRL